MHKNKVLNSVQIEYIPYVCNDIILMLIIIKHKERKINVKKLAYFFVWMYLCIVIQERIKGKQF